jgi:uncharacterized protein YjbI with pentapeptide repeats/cellulose biosynthesis protein BcsQ
MALANVAWILASNGKRVLVLDWDLEAPGLHRYFYPFLVDKELTDSDGVIDLIINFTVEATTPPETDVAVSEDWYRPYANILNYAAALNWDFGGSGILDFVPAGRQGRSYPTRVNSFNWEDFYNSLGGGVFLEAVKEQMREEYDYILIDSRTGVSDTSGICTVQMPDILVVCFTLNNQSISGAAAVANSAYEQRLESNLQVLPVPMRIENAEQEKLNLRWEYAKREFARFSTQMAQEEKWMQYWAEVAVPYVPYYAYEEILAIFGDRQRRTNSVLAATEKLTNYLTSEWVDQVVVEESTRQEVLAQYEGKDTVPPSSEQDKILEDYFNWMRRLLRDERLRELDRENLVRIDTRARTLTILGKLDNNRKRDLLRFLHEANLIKRQDPTGSSEYPVIGLGDADLSKANLEYMDLSNDSLYGIKAEKTNLSYANLIHVDLHSSDLVAANLANAGLLNAYLRDASLTNAVLINALLANADLRAAELTGANLSQANLSGAHLNVARLRLANLGGADLGGSDLTEADLSETNLSGASLSDANLARANLRQANLRDANLARANLRQANLRAAHLTEAHLRGAVLSEADLSNADLRAAHLNNADLRGADLRNANLIEADLSETNLEDAITINNQELAACKSLAGATMPDGRRFRSERQRLITATVWAATATGLLAAITTALITLYFRF